MGGVLLDPVTGRPTPELELLLPDHIAASLRLSRLLGEDGPRMMADSKITDLSDGGAIVDTDEFVVARSGADKKIAGSQIAAAALVQVSTVSLTSGDLTTTSTSFTDATGLTTTITTGAHRCLVIFSAAGHNNGSGSNIAVDLAIDGTRQGQTYGLLTHAGQAGSNANDSLGFVYLTNALSAASHTFKIQFRVDGGTGTIFASTGVTPAILTVIELGI